MSGYRNYIGNGKNSKEIRAATATTGKTETPTLNFFGLEAEMSGYRNYNGYGPKKRTC